MVLRLLLLALLCGGVSAGFHSLRYFSTAVTPGSGVPEFITVRYVDELLISYYDSELRRTVPRQQWMAETQGPDYWERETRISQGDEQWAQAKIQTLMNRTNQTSDPPEVSFTASEDGRQLSCVATGFYPQYIDVTILRDGRILEEIHFHGILPNHDNTYQLTRTVRVEPTDTAKFSCRVEHRGLPEPLVLFLDPVPGFHSLRYFSTAVTPGSGVPEFITVRYVDELLISYYDSVLRRSVPRQQWMAETQGPDYWERETRISQGDEQWAQAEIQTLMYRTNQTSGIHFLQRMSGCELRDDGTTAGFLQYGWDGSDFILFDKDRMVWVTPVPWGIITKNKWDRDTAMNQGWKGYLEHTCIEWLMKYVKAGGSHLEPNPPEVSFTASEDGRQLSCVATGFYPQYIDVTILRDGRILEEIHFHGILPNHDNTYQLTRTVRVEPTDTAKFSCRVEHRGLPEPLVLFLDPVPGFHSLRYFSTAVTPGSGVPEFITVRYVDELLISYYDSELRRSVPRQQWMAETQGPDYWERETRISQGDEQWAQAEIQTLMYRTNQTSGIHFLQRMSGCELRDDGTTAGFLQYGWDGSDFILFDKDRMVWVTPVPWGIITKNKWDRDMAMNQGWKGYLEHTCIEWLMKYVKAGGSHLEPNPPEVSFTASEAGRQLSCVATGFYPQSIDVTILRNGRILEETHSHGILPNHDNTYQLTRTVRVEPTDTAKFSCRVEHRGLPEPLVLFLASDKGESSSNSSAMA
ncbi:uncharacterized protein LOC134346730 isoform X2 [Mobula hypostoma]|uniref:uncharacterized protein LOC134346730 isoform X2 n=1 Tax=Mobula hypostoma TaxID=723540 RepID=UPI002FC27DD8